MQIQQMIMTANSYGPDKGRLTGSIKFANDGGEITLNIDQASCDKIVKLCAAALVESANKVANLMAADVIESSCAPCLENKGD